MTTGPFQQLRGNTASPASIIALDCPAQNAGVPCSTRSIYSNAAHALDLEFIIHLWVLSICDRHVVGRFEILGVTGFSLTVRIPTVSTQVYYGTEIPKYLTPEIRLMILEYNLESLRPQEIPKITV